MTYSALLYRDKAIRVYRVTGFLSSRPNWVSPPPHPQGSVAPPPPHSGLKAETHSLSDEGRGTRDSGTLTKIPLWTRSTYVPSPQLFSIIFQFT